MLPAPQVANPFAPSSMVPKVTNSLAERYLLQGETRKCRCFGLHGDARPGAGRTCPLHFDTIELGDMIVCGLPASPHDSETHSTQDTSIAGASLSLLFSAWCSQSSSSPHGYLPEMALSFSASGLQADDALAMTIEEDAGTLANYTVEL